MAQRQLRVSQMLESTPEPIRSPHAPKQAQVQVLIAIVLLGLAIRLLLLFSAERRLDCDEALVAFMATDILEGQSLPLFFYGNSYNGGGAFEAYLAAAGFALLGCSPLLLKGVVLSVWAAAAMLLADLSRRALPAGPALCAMLCFALASPFQLEWSLKARGGFIETVAMSGALLWLLLPPRWLLQRPALRHVALGLMAGIGLWLSEMLLPMAACAVCFAVLLAPGDRWRVVGWTVLGAVIGLSPLLLYNLTHHWDHLTQSVVFRMVAGPAQAKPLSFEELFDSWRFVFGPTWWLVCPGLVVVVMHLGRRKSQCPIAWLLLAHTLLYIFGYWLAGLRALPVPPSRVLLAIYPGVAVLMGIAMGGPYGSAPARWAARLAVIGWIAIVSGDVVRWMQSGAPREYGSWRGTWALAHGTRIYNLLRDSQTEVVYTDYWTAWPIAFAARCEARRGSSYRLRAMRARHVVWNSADPNSAGVIIATSLPNRPIRAGHRAAIVVVAGSKAQQGIEHALRRRPVDYHRTTIGDHVVITRLDAAQIPRRLHIAIDGPDAWPPWSRGDQFN